MKILRIITFLLLGLFLIIGMAFFYYRTASLLRENKSAEEVAPKEGKFIQTKYGKIFIQEKGSPKDNTILFIHGMGAWSELWKETMGAVAKEGFHVITVDFPPFGFSERPKLEELDSRTKAKRILSLLDALEIEKATIVGHSFGGGPVLHSALLVPERIQHLVLIDIAADTEIKNTDTNSIKSTFHFLNFIHIKNPIIAATLTNPRLTGFLFKKFVFKENAITEERIKILQQPMELKGSTDYMGNFVEYLATYVDNSLAEDIQNSEPIQIPTLLIWGDKDTVTPMERGYFFNKFIQGSKLEIIKDTGHIPQIESPEEFQRILISDLKKYSR